MCRRARLEEMEKLGWSNVRIRRELRRQLTAVAGLTVIANTLWPLNRGGLRPDVIWTAGLEYNF